MKREFRSNGVYDLFIYSAFIYSHFKQKHGEAYSNGRKIPMQRNFTETQGAIQLRAHANRSTNPRHGLQNRKMDHLGQAAGIN